MSLKDALEARELYLQHNETPLLKRGLDIKGLAKPMTNGDRIRAMTDREIAEWLSCPAVVEGKPCFYPGPREKMCLDCCFDWLREPVKEDAE